MAKQRQKTDSELLTAAEVCKLLNLMDWELEDKVKRGKIPFVQASKDEKRYSLKVVRRLAKSSTFLHDENPKERKLREAWDEFQMSVLCDAPEGITLATIKAATKLLKVGE